MATKKLFIVEERMLKVMHYVIANTIKNVSTQQAFCDSIGLLKGAVAQIRNGIRGFTTEQILAAHKVYDVNLEFIFGTSDVMFIPDMVKETPMEILKKAVAVMDSAYSTKTTIGLVSKKKERSAKTSA